MFPKAHAVAYVIMALELVGLRFIVRFTTMRHTFPSGNCLDVEVMAAGKMLSEIS